MTKLIFVASLFVILAMNTMAKKSFKMPPNARRELSKELMDKLPKMVRDPRHRAIGMIPDNFDSRQKWPKCKSISTIRNQGQCGTCWAVSSASVISDRICVASGQTVTDVFISAAQCASCSQPDSDSTANCEDGGDAQQVYEYAIMRGIATGGEYNTDIGCVPYPVAPNQHPPISCSRRCTNSDYTKSIDKDLYFVEGYWANYKSSSERLSQQEINDRVRQIQEDVMVNGPITVAMTVWSDFQDWEPPMEPYCEPSYGAENKGGHAVRLIGWKKTSKGKKAWLIANSWGADMGDKGIYEIEMGKNCVGIEHALSAPQIKVPNTCTTSSFCDQAIDAAIPIDPNNAQSDIYLFQGNCTLKVSVGADGKLTPKAAADPLSKQIVGAPSGPITGYLAQSGQLWIVNEKGEAGADCKVPQGATKVACNGKGTVSGSGSVSAVIPGTGNKWSFDNRQPTWLFNYAGRGSNIGTVISNSFSKVKTMLSTDGKKLVVFGLDKSSKPIAGVIALPITSSSQWTVQPGPQKNLFTKCSA